MSEAENLKHAKRHTARLIFGRLGRRASERARGIAIAFAVSAQLGLCGWAFAAGATVPPPLAARDVAILDRVLRFDASQREIATALLDDCLASGGDAADRSRLAEQLALVLNDDQREALASAWALVFRERIEAGAIVGGEGVDVGALLEELLREPDAARATPAEARARAEAVVSRYRVEIVPLLEVRLGTRSERDSAGPEALRAALSLRDRNDAAIAELSALLPAGLAERLATGAAERGFSAACEPSVPIAALGELLGQLPRDEVSAALAAIEADAREKFDRLKVRAIATMRARDGARVGGEAAQAAALRDISGCESAYEELDQSTIAAVRRAASDELLRSAPAGRRLLAYAENNAAERQIRWDDQQATLERFDENRNGTLDEDEATKAMTAFAKSTGGGRRRRL